MHNVILDLFNQLLLPLFIMALLFGIAGVSPEIVVRGFISVVSGIIEGVFKLLVAIINDLLRGRRPSHPPRSGQAQEHCQSCGRKA